MPRAGYVPSYRKGQKPSCRKGHALTQDNVLADRACRICAGEAKRRYKKKHARPRAIRTSCSAGHAFPENRRRGRYDCAICHREDVKRTARLKLLASGRAFHLRDGRCVNGHELTLDNRTAGRKNGRCLTCHRLRENGIRTKEAVAYASILLNDPCSYCVSGVTEEIDHIVPVSKGGSKGRDNLTGACGSCNRRKRTRSLLHFLCEIATSPGG